MRPKVIVLRAAGTNCDIETAFAFKTAGALPELVHINELFRKEKKLSDYDIMAIPGGFSYGDDIAAGKILANEIKYLLKKDILAFADAGKPIIGICNGFQVLVKTGLLPGTDKGLCQDVTLTFNDSGKFEDRWVYLKRPAMNGPGSLWTRNLPRVIYLPVAHGEGKFVVSDKTILNKLENNGQISFQYCDKSGNMSGYPSNPNGSIRNIAGITNERGNILGMMPHPERFISKYGHPRWARGEYNNIEGMGLSIFKNAVAYAANDFK